MSKLLFVSRVANDCVIALQTSRCLHELNMCTDCTCDMAERKAMLCERLTPWFEYYLNITDKYVDVAALCIGLLSNSLLLVTLMEKTFYGLSTFVYIRIICLVGLMLIAVQFARQILVRSGVVNSTSYHYVLFVYACPLVSNGLKLAVSTLSGFLCIDRLVGVTAPTVYHKVNNFKCISFACGFSAVVGSVVFLQAVDVRLIRNALGEYRVTILKSGVYHEKATNIVLIIRLSEIALMIAVTFMIVVFLRKHQQRLMTMMPEEIAATETKKMTNLCRFQIIETVEVIVDLMCLCWYDLMTQVFRPFSPSVVPHTYAQYLGIYPTIVAICISYILQNTMLQFSHFFMFFLYLAFSKPFRRTFFRLFRCKCNRVTVIVDSWPRVAQ